MKDRIEAIKGPGQSLRCVSCRRVIRVVQRRETIVCPYCGQHHDGTTGTTAAP